MITFILMITTIAAILAPYLFERYLDISGRRQTITTSYGKITITTGNADETTELLTQLAEKLE